MAVTALQSNAQPVAGTTATQPVPPALTPADIDALVQQMAPAVEKFRDQSSPLKVALDAQTLNLGDSKSIRIASVGLGVRIITHHSCVISLINAATAAQVVNFSDVFPFNLLRQTLVQINGGATVYAADGLGTFAVMTRNKPGTWDTYQAPSGFGPGLSRALVKITNGANSTITNRGNQGNMSGLASTSIAGSSTGVVTVDFWTVEKLCLDRQSLLGMLPLQNNSTYATLTRQLVNSAVGAGPNNHAVPMFTAGAVPGTLTHTVVDTVTSTYDFWSVPGDPGLYQEMVQNSYQVQQQQSLAVAVTGPAALTYNIPQNQFMVAAHIWAFDSQGNLLPADSGGISLLQLLYNAGSVRPVQHFADRERAAQFLDYSDDRQFVGGYRFWDGEDTTEMIQSADQAGWIDTYLAATPQLVGDIAAGLNVPLSLSITRESVVAGAVQVVGG
ncbi:MAG TPA: hypothetical protein VNH17_21060 [Streptosporangiaceae bacterium]|nr:hypothetical protein [Streptosporangiaceae bacterium]